MRARSATRSRARAPRRRASSASTAARRAAKSRAGGAGAAARAAATKRCSDGERRRALRGAGAAEEEALERLVERLRGRVGAPRAPRRERARRRERKHLVDERADAALDVAHDGAHVVVARAVDLVEDAEDVLAPGVGEPERLLLRGLGGLADREDPHEGVGLDEELARHLLVLGPDRVQPRRVDDLDAAERLERVEDLDDAHGGRLRVGELAQERAHRGGPELARRAVVKDDARARRLAVSQDVDRGRGGRHARGGDLLADERVDEGRLARVELAHDGDEQRAIEGLERAARAHGERDQRGRARREAVRPAEQADQARPGRGQGRVGGDDEALRRLVGRDARQRHEIVVARRVSKKGAQRLHGERLDRVGGRLPASASSSASRASASRSCAASASASRVRGAGGAPSSASRRATARASGQRAAAA